MPRLTLIKVPSRDARCGLCVAPMGDPFPLARWMFYAADAGAMAQNAIAVCQRHAVELTATAWVLGQPMRINGALVPLPEPLAAIPLAPIYEAEP